MDYQSEKHKKLSEQLTTWWSAQSKFKTKKEMAGALGVHPDTLGDYFAGRKFPMPDIENRLYELIDIPSLESGAISGAPPRIDPPGPAVPVSAKESKESIVATRSGQPNGERSRERSVVISIQRKACPFCRHDITRFRGCPFCGQEFIWANVPLEQDVVKTAQA